MFRLEQELLKLEQKLKTVFVKIIKGDYNLMTLQAVYLNNYLTVTFKIELISSNKHGDIYSITNSFTSTTYLFNVPKDDWKSVNKLIIDYIERTENIFNRL